MTKWRVAASGHLDIGGDGWKGLTPERLGASAAGHYRQCADENLEVEPDTPVLDVGGIEGDVAVKRGVLPRLYLPQAGHAGEHVETPQMAQVVALYFAGDRWTGADHAHVT